MAKENMLTDFEMNTVVPMIAETLRSKIGEYNATKSHEILGWLQACRIEIDPGRFRIMINYIRSNDLVIGLVANGKGYFRTDDPEELQRWIDKEIGIIKQKTRPIKRLRNYLLELRNKPALIN